MYITTQFVIKLKRLQIIIIGGSMIKFEEYVNILKRNFKGNKKNILFVCIGTNKVLADSVGPIVGTYLKEKLNKNLIIGDCNKNVCKRTHLIYNYLKIKNKYIVAIDSAIASPKLIGEIFITQKPIQMGMASNNEKGKVGNLGIKIAISSLQIMNKEFIENRAKFVAKGIIKAML